MQTAMTALSKSKPASLAVEALPGRAVATLFDHLKAALGPKMLDVLAGNNIELVMHEWALGLAGFRGREIERGLAACRTRAFAPNLGEFATLCRPCLDSDMAFLEAGACLRQRDEGQVGDWTHPAVFRAACRMSMEVRSGDATAWMRKRWRFTLQNELAKGWGDEVPEPPVRIAHAVVTGPPNEVARAALAELRGRLGQSSAVNPTDESIEVTA